MDADGLQFEVRINADDGFNVKRRKLDIVSDEEGKASTTACATIATQQSVTWERRIRRFRTELSLLDAGNHHVIVMQERGKFPPRGVDSIDVDLENARRW